MKPMDEKLSIRDIAHITGLSKDTLRYYEKIGLIDPVERAPNRHRRYSREDITWIEFLKRLRETGMSIRQMQHYAYLRRQGDSTLAERRRLLEAHQRSVEEQISDLEQLLTAIKEKIEIYQQMEEVYNAGRNDPV